MVKYIFACLICAQSILMHSMIDFQAEYQKLEQQKQAVEKQELQAQARIAVLNSNRDKEVFAVAVWLGVSAMASTLLHRDRASSVTFSLGVGLGIAGLLEFQKKSFNVYEQASRKVQMDLQLAQAELRGRYALLEQLKALAQQQASQQPDIQQEQ